MRSVEKYIFVLLKHFVFLPNLISIRHSKKIMATLVSSNYNGNNNNKNNTGLEMIAVFLIIMFAMSWSMRKEHSDNVTASEIKRDSIKHDSLVKLGYKELDGYTDDTINTETTIDTVNNN